VKHLAGGGVSSRAAPGESYSGPVHPRRSRAP